jgi:hypothetical protein
MTYFGCVNEFARHVYFLTNLKYANKLLKHMSRGYIACPRCRRSPRQVRLAELENSLGGNSPLSALCPSALARVCTRPFS